MGWGGTEWKGTDLKGMGKDVMEVQNATGEGGVVVGRN